MIDIPTILVLGAGASCPYGYPDGQRLREEIWTHFHRESTEHLLKKPVSQAQRERVSAKAKYFATTFRKSSTKSIDLFLARNPLFMDMGKAAILFRILAAEKKSRFREDVSDRSQDWYTHLFHILTRGLPKKQDYERVPTQNKLTIITFNYDRSLEYFLHESLVNAFREIPEIKLIDQLKRLKIIHIFGRVASLPWQGDGEGIQYRTEVSALDIARLTKNIKIIYEDSPAPQIKEARDAIKEAHRIFLLGFGYAKENLEVLEVPDILKPSQYVYGTAIGLEEKEANDIKGIFVDAPKGKQPPGNIRIEKAMDCLRLLRNYL